MKKQIYLDHAAATPIDPRVGRAMLIAMRIVGNPSSFNDAGRQAAAKLQDARASVAHFLHARPQEIIFTGSGSESNTLTIQGLLKSHQLRRVITTPIEHKSVLENIKNPVFMRVDEEGFVDLEDLRKKITRDTLLVSIMYANNEIGTIEPIGQIAKIIRQFRTKHASDFPLLHVDACQAPEYLDMDVQRLGADLVSFNGSKVYGPRGIGVLYIRRGVRLAPLVRGGGQEAGLRAGTENLPAIAGLTAALNTVRKQEGARVAALRDYFMQQLHTVLPEARLNGPRGEKRLANNINISIPDLKSEDLLLELDARGIAAGSGSACTARSVEPSHVLKAIGVPKRFLSGALRFSFGRTTTKKDIDILLRQLPRSVAAVRARYS